jgi:hypothetical protein
MASPSLNVRSPGNTISWNQHENDTTTLMYFNNISVHLFMCLTTVKASYSRALKQSSSSSLSSVALQSLQGPRPHHTGGFVIILRNAVGFLWTSDHPFEKTSTYIGQHNKETKKNIHDFSGIRTHDPNNQVAKTYALDRRPPGPALKAIHYKIIQ